MSKPLVIDIAVPSHDLAPAFFAYDLANLYSYTILNIAGAKVGLDLVVGTYLRKARTELIVSAVERGCHYMLWLDSDMRFPRDSAVRLLKRIRDNDDVTFVGANYAKRRVPSTYVAIKKEGLRRDGSCKCPTFEDSTGLEEVDAIGFGCALMRLDCLADLGDPTEDPWFLEQHVEGSVIRGEDVAFCKRWREAGHKVHVDHDLSKEVTHLGLFEYSYRFAEQEWKDGNEG